MKISYLLIAVMISFCSLAAISREQDNNNIIYLDELDQRMISSIELLETFNNSAKNMVYTTYNAEDFSRYLMDLTLECSRIRQLIERSLDMEKEERDAVIRTIFDFTKPYNIEYIENIIPENDQNNKVIMNKLFNEYEEKLNRLRNSILREEENINRKHRITQRYLELHNRHFVYHLILDFISDHYYLSAGNRLYLLNLISAIEDEMIKSGK